jgi:hypothetical protein
MKEPTKAVVSIGEVFWQNCWWYHAMILPTLLGQSPQIEMIPFVMCCPWQPRQAGVRYRWHVMVGIFVIGHDP